MQTQRIKLDISKEIQEIELPIIRESVYAVALNGHPYVYFTKQQLDCFEAKMVTIAIKGYRQLLSNQEYAGWIFLGAFKNGDSDFVVLMKNKL